MGKRFTFKKEPKITGLARVGNPNSDTDIRWEGKSVGSISAPNWNTEDNKWDIQLMVKSDKLSSWAWKRLKARFDTEPEARAFLNGHVEAIVAIGLHQFDDE